MEKFPAVVLIQRKAGDTRGHIVSVGLADRIPAFTHITQGSGAPETAGRPGYAGFLNRVVGHDADVATRCKGHDRKRPFHEGDEFAARQFRQRQGLLHVTALDVTQQRDL